MFAPTADTDTKHSKGSAGETGMHGGDAVSPHPPFASLCALTPFSSMAVTLASSDMGSSVTTKSPTRRRSGRAR